MGSSGRFAMASSEVRGSEAGTDDDPRVCRHAGTGPQRQNKLDDTRGEVVAVLHVEEC